MAGPGQTASDIRDDVGPSYDRPTARSLPMALLRGREAVMKHFRPLLVERGFTEQQWRVLRVLDERGPLEALAIAQSACILPPSLSRILAALETRGMIARKPDPQDRRRAAIALTDAAKEILAEAAPQSTSAYAQIEQAFGRDELEQLLDLLERLAETRPGSEAP